MKITFKKFDFATNHIFIEASSSLLDSHVDKMITLNFKGGSNYSFILLFIFEKS